MFDLLLHGSSAYGRLISDVGGQRRRISFVRIIKMRRTNWKTVSTLVTMIVVAGCQDNLVSVPQNTSSAPTSMLMAPQGMPQISLDRHSSDGGSDGSDVDFTVTPNGGTFYIGKHAVVFPARSICDPDKSSYGEGTWDSPCTALKGAMKIHASVRSAKLGIWIDFKPSLRFVPSNDPRQWVYLFMNTPDVIGAKDLSKYSMLFAPSLGAKGIDDAAGDATLRTYIDTRTGTTMRRIEHFTGYMTSSGRSCDPSSESDCYPTSGDMLQ
jgi:hypothetical protein